MSIKGIHNMENWGEGIYFSSPISGTVLGLGVLFGFLFGWHALAISFIVSGGIFFPLSITIGMKMIIKAKNLRIQEQESLKKVSQAYQANVSNL